MCLLCWVFLQLSCLKHTQYIAVPIVSQSISIYSIVAPCVMIALPCSCQYTAQSAGEVWFLPCYHGESLLMMSLADIKDKIHKPIGVNAKHWEPIKEEAFEKSVSGDLYFCISSVWTENVSSLIPVCEDSWCCIQKGVQRHVPTPNSGKVFFKMFCWLVVKFCFRVTLVYSPHHHDR